MKRTLLLIPACLSAALSLAQTSDSIPEGKAGITDVAESDPGLFVVMMMILLGLMVLFAFAVVATMIVIVMTAVLASAGVLSLSLFAGLYKRSASAGIKTLVYASFSGLGLLGGLAGYYTYVRYNHLNFSWQDAALAGMPIGLLAGVGSAWLAIAVFRYLFRYLSGWLRDKLPGNDIAHR